MMPPSQVEYVRRSQLIKVTTANSSRGDKYNIQVWDTAASMALTPLLCRNSRKQAEDKTHHEKKKENHLFHLDVQM